MPALADTDITQSTVVKLRKLKGGWRVGGTAIALIRQQKVWVVRRDLRGDAEADAWLERTQLLDAQFSTRRQAL